MVHNRTALDRKPSRISLIRFSKQTPTQSSRQKTLLVQTTCQTIAASALNRSGHANGEETRAVERVRNCSRGAPSAGALAACSFAFSGRDPANGPLSRQELKIAGRGRFDGVVPVPLIRRNITLSHRTTRQTRNCAAI